MKKPWDIMPELQPDRLDVIGKCIETARDNVSELRDSESGDNPWAHGCRAYAWSGTELENASKKYDWLDATMHNNIFDGAIGKVPFTLSKDDPTEISKRTRKKMARLPDHERETQLDFGFKHIWSDEQVRFCFIIEATANEVFGVACLGVLKSGRIVARYKIDLVNEVKLLVDTETASDIPHEVPEYQPGFKNDNNTKQGDNDINGSQDEQRDVDGGKE